MNQSATDDFSISAYIIERTAKRLKLSFSRILNEHDKIDVTVDQWVILQILHEEGCLSQMQLAKQSNKDAPTVTRILDILVKKGYAERITSTEDRRRFDVVPTQRGENLVHEIYPLVYDFRKTVYNGLSPQELKTLEESMLRIETNIVENFKK